MTKKRERDKERESGGKKQKKYRAIEKQRQ